MSDDLDFIVIDDIPEYVFCIPDDEELENVIPIKGEDGSFKYEKVAELPETGEDGVLYLVPKSHEAQTASGNPISINVTEGAGKLSDLKLDGGATQQTYSGKNLLGLEDVASTSAYGVTYSVSNGAIAINGTTSSAGRILIPLKNAVTLTNGTAYTLSKTVTGTMSGGYFEVQLRPIENDTNIVTIRHNALPSTFSNANGVAAYLGLYLGSGRVFDNYVIRLQLELGSSATDYEQYVGGIPAPNPAYLQDINVVTGTQTIDINGTSYPINLGNIWLAEVGAHQDGIKKTDGKWYVEKQVGKVVLDGTQELTLRNTSANNTYTYSMNTPLDYKTESSAKVISDHFVGLDTVQGVSMMYNATRYLDVLGISLYYNPTNPTANSVYINSNVQLPTWLSTHPTTVYYALATPTTTQITDTNLINQLEAARNAALANGTNVISNTATGANLAGDLELSYYEYDPTNKYNKWLWLDDDAAYEQM